MERHIGLAHHIVARYERPGRRDGDLVQVALLGLVKAVERFDVGRGVQFSTFAGRTIEGELKRHFRDDSWKVRVPRSVKDLHLALRRASEDLAHGLGRTPTVRELADHLDVPVDDIVGALGADTALRPVSLDAPVDGGPTDHLAALGEAGHETRTDDRDQVRQLLSVLDEREREIVHLRFYENLSQDQIAERVGLSQMHVSRLLRQSFAAMLARAQDQESRRT